LNNRRWWNPLAVKARAFPTPLIFFLHTSITQQVQLPLVFFEVGTAQNRLVSHDKQNIIFAFSSPRIFRFSVPDAYCGCRSKALAIRF
jgi:hypothetical protein